MKSIAKALCLLIGLIVFSSKANGAPAVFSGGDIVAWWRGNGSEDDAIGGHHAALQGTAGYGAGVVGQAFVNLNSQNNFVQAPGNGLKAPGSSVTVENWVKVDALHTQWAPLSVVKPGMCGLWYNRDGKYLRAHAAKNRVFHDGHYFDAPFELPLGQWVHVAQVLDAASGIISVYVNGALVASSAGTMFYWGANGDGPLQIGKGWQPWEWFANYQAAFDEVTVFSRALSAAEVAAIYNAGADGKIAAPVITTAGLPEALPGVAYEAAIRTRGGRAPMSFAIVSGGLPAGINMASDGRITGMASAPGVSTLTVLATDADGFTVQRDYTLRVEACGVAAGVPDGTWDASFSRLMAPVANGGRGGSAQIARQSDGKLLHLTWINPAYPLPAGVTLTRYNAQGIVDTTFGNNGSIFRQNGSGGEVRSMIVQPDDKILMLSFLWVQGNNRFALYRFLPNGALDTSFGNNGVSVTGVTPYDEARALALQPDGKIIAVGSSTRFTAFQDGNFLVMRFNANGTLDNSFGNGGIVETQTGETEEPNAVTLQPDGKILVLGTAGASQVYGDIGFRFQVVRYNTDGSVDTSFGTNGVSHVRFVRYDFARSITVQPDGKILVGGWADNSWNLNWIAMARLFPDGKLDECFGDRGKVITQYFDKTMGRLSSTLSATMHLQNDGRIVVGGATSVGPDGETYLARFYSNGSIDKSFGVDGWALGGWQQWGRAMWTGTPFLIEPSGNFVVASTVQLSGLEAPALARFTGTGLCEWIENTAPVAVDDTAATGQNSIDIDVLANDSDAEGDAPRITRIIADARAHGTAVLIGTKIRYTPVAGFDGEALFQYEISDCPGLTAIATVRVQVDCNCNHAPMANAQSVQINEDTPALIELSGSDVDGDALSATVVSMPAHGALTMGADGLLTYTPEPNYNGLDAFAFTVSDGRDESAPAEISITVLPVNDAPVGANDEASGAEETTILIDVLANDNDIDGDVLSVASFTSPAHGTLALNPDGTLGYTPEANYYGADSFRYVVSDGQGGSDEANVSITVTPVNDAPGAAADEAFTTEDTAFTSNVVANDTDIDGGSLVVIAITQPANGAAILNDDGTIAYVPAANFSGNDSLDYTISDGNGGSATSTLTITVLPADDTPVADADNASTPEETAVIIAVLANDSDIDSALAVGAITQPQNGVAVLNEDGTVTYTPNADFNGVDSFAYTVEGSAIVSAVRVTVLPVNDAPAAANDSASTAQDAAVAIAVLANDSDIEGDALAVFEVAAPANGLAAINPDGTITYTPNAGFSGSDSFSYTLSDGHGGFAVGTVAIAVTPAQPPLITSRGKVTGGGSIDASGSRATFGFEALVTGNGRIQGNVTFHDSSANRHFKSAEVTSIRVSADRLHAIIEGRGTINGAHFVNFVIEVNDLGEPGGGVDRFAISLSDGYSAGGTVIRPGNIQIHK